MLLYKCLPVVWNDEMKREEIQLFEKRCDCLKNNLFWFSTPSGLNDPYDCKPLYKIKDDLASFEAVLGELDEHELALVLKKFPKCSNKQDLLNLFHQIHSSSSTDGWVKRFVTMPFQHMASEIVKAKVSNLGVLSFTEDPKNISMWAHYASNHQGLCVEVEIPENTHSLKKVEYVPVRPEFDLHEIMNERHGRLFDLFYTKSIHWEKEAEWRMVAHQGGETKKIPGVHVKRVIFGLNTNEQTKKRVTDIVGPDIEFANVSMGRNYELVWTT